VIEAAALFVAFFVSHHVGDYLLQTDWQARNKTGGLGGDPVARRALLSHATTYTLALVPALVWVGTDAGAGMAVLAGALVFVPHLVVDDGRLLHAYLRRVKRCPDPLDQGVTAMTDQALHLLMLWGVAVLATG
jgi:hypothetical protein